MLAKRAELAEGAAHVVAMGAAGLPDRGDDNKYGANASHDEQCQRTEAQPQRMVVRRSVARVIMITIYFLAVGRVGTFILQYRWHVRPSSVVSFQALLLFGSLAFHCSVAALDCTFGAPSNIPYPDLNTNTCK